jgi:hypothetical protein
MTYQVTNPMTGMLNKPVSPSMAVTNAVNKATSTPTDVTRLGTIAPQVQPTVNNAPAQTLANTVGTMSEQFQLAPAPTPTPTQAPAPAPAPAPQEQSILQKTLDSIMGVSTQLESKGQRSLEIQQEEGVFDYKEQVENYKNEFIAKERAFDKQIEEAKKNNEGKLRGGVQIDIQGLESRKFSQLADIAFLHEISSGKYERAWQIAQAKIDAEFAPLVARLDTLKSYYQLAQNDMTESEKLQAQTKIREQESALDFQRTKELALYRTQLEQADPLYQQQLANARQSSVKLAPTQVIDQGGRKLLINSQTGEILKDFGTTNVATDVLQMAQKAEYISTVDALKNHAGISKSVGVTGLARFTPFKVDVMTGQVADFTASVEQLASGLTLTSLIQAKEQGATFGALSDGEREVLAKAGTKINAWKRERDDGSVYYAASEKDFKRELDKISNFAKLDYVLKGGSPTDVGLVQMKDGTWWTENSDGSKTQIR